MGIFGRMWGPVKGWLLTGIDRVEEPECILDSARHDPKRELNKAMSDAVQAIADRNRLYGLLRAQIHQSTNLEAKARRARQAGSEDLVGQLLIQKQIHDERVEGLRAQVAQAEQAAEALMADITQKQLQIRQEMAQRLDLVADWRQAELHDEALSGLLKGRS